jgi:hypothetical protein
MVELHQDHVHLARLLDLMDKQVLLIASDGDPDFIYGFGYYDWFPGGFILSYSNYASNSYPWRANKGGSFSDGSITIAYNIRFNTLCDLLWGKKPKKRKPSQTRFPWGPPRLIWGF